jgi:hypothetical protein
MTPATLHGRLIFRQTFSLARRLRRFETGAEKLSTPKIA